MDPEKNLQGEGHESQWCPYLYPKFKKLNGFRTLYFGGAGALFSGFFFIFSDKPVVPLLGRWCSWQARGGPDKYVVSLGSSVLLAC